MVSVGADGEIEMLVTEAATVIAFAPLVPFNVAVIVALPTPVAVTRPALTVATLAFDVAQVAEPVRSLVLPSLYFPVAVSCRVSPTFIAALDDELTLIVLNVTTGGVGVLNDELPPPQAMKKERRTKMDRRTAQRDRCSFKVASKLVTRVLPR